MNKFNLVYFIYYNINTNFETLPINTSDVSVCSVVQKIKNIYKLELFKPFNWLISKLQTNISINNAVQSKQAI